MPELMIDFITSLDGYGAAEGWPGWWGLEGPEYLAWLGDQPEAGYTVLMGANTYRLMSGLVADREPQALPERVLYHDEHAKPSDPGRSSGLGCHRAALAPLHPTPSEPAVTASKPVACMRVVRSGPLSSVPSEQLLARS